MECSSIAQVVHIKYLYVNNPHRGKGLGEVLLTKAMEYAAQKRASEIICYCGPEPFCQNGQIPTAEEVSWYEAHGFIHDHDVCGMTPCMMLSLPKGVEE